MSLITPVARSTHGHRRWKRYKNYLFAVHDTTAPLVVAEFARACMAFPIAFVQTDGGYAPAALLGLVKNQNAFVSPDGRWLGGYVPAFYRGYPFRLGQTLDGQRMLCIDEGSGLVVDTADESQSEPFFDEAGSPVVTIQRVLTFLSQVADNQGATSSVCDLLEVNKLLEPWPLKVRTASGDHELEGFHRVNESALRSLKSRAVTTLHKEGALHAAYCQVLSMQNFAVLPKLIEANVKMTALLPLGSPPTGPSGEIDFSFLAD
jgi:hypothetical protein